MTTQNHSKSHGSAASVTDFCTERHLIPEDLIEAAPDLFEALEKAAKIIREHVPEDALGIGGGICPEPGMPDQTWPIKDEELYYMERALRKAKGEDNG